MMNEEIEKLYQAEIKQSDVDHHTPTAGAMTGHIVSNLRILSNKLNQLEWYIKGDQYFADVAFIKATRETVDNYFNELGHKLVELGEFPASVTEEYVEYSMIKEDGRFKYYEASQMFEMLVEDIATSKMFVSRAILLAQKESKFDLQNYLINLDGYFNRVSAQMQARLNKTALEGLVEDEDDD